MGPVEGRPADSPPAGRGGRRPVAAPGLTSGDARNPARLAESLAAQARGPLIDALVKAGLRRVDRKPEAVEVLPQDLDPALNRMTAISQFAAVRSLHDLARARGGSAIVLGGLARDYALLGVLNEHLWDPAHKVQGPRAPLRPAGGIGRP